MKYLITGIAGTGKSTVAEALKKAGLNTYDIDADTDIAYSKNTVTGKKEVVADPRPKDWRINHVWVWDELALNKFLSTHAKNDIFLCGYADNQSEYFHLFDHVFGLSLDSPTLKHRLATRTNNTYGRQKIELDEALRRNPEIVASVVDQGGTAIDNRLPLDQSVSEIIRLTNGK